MQSYQLGVIGLGTMGASMARNAAAKGMRVSVFNRSKEKTEAFTENHKHEGAIVPADTLEQFIASLQAPRVVLLMVNAGKPVDDVLLSLLPLLSTGDCIIDGGNSHYTDTEHRMKAASQNEVSFIGMGISGGEEGALKGPSMMPGGKFEAYKEVAPLLSSLAADDGMGGKCIAYMGEEGAGHFVKMIHNGIEYGLMQLIAEVYEILRAGCGKSVSEIGSLFRSWSKDERGGSFLLECSAEILERSDDLHGNAALIDSISDRALQKGTGIWTLEAAGKYAVPVPTIAAAVDARFISADALLRMKYRGIPGIIDNAFLTDEDTVRSLKNALLLSSVVTYAQGFNVIESASVAEHWGTSLAEVARIWRNGCIIRSALLPMFQEMFAGNGESEQKLAAFLQGSEQHDWRKIVASAALRGIAVPCLSASLSYLDAARSVGLPQNLIQAQRDFFGSHGYERKDREGIFHTHWR